MAKGAIEAALWDAEAKQKGVPLWACSAASKRDLHVESPLESRKQLRSWCLAVQREMAAGYQRIKIKIKPGKDIEPVKRLRQRFPRIRLMVDANSAYRLSDAPHLKRMEAYYLMMIEQPLGWDDLYSHAELQRMLETPICLDESIRTVEHARAAINLGACRIPRVAGLYISGSSIGGFCGRFIPGVLTDLIGWRLAFAVVALLTLVAAVIVSLTLPREQRFVRSGGLTSSLIQMIPAHGVDCDGQHSLEIAVSVTARTYSCSTSTTSRPLYCPQCGQARWGSFCS